MHSSNDTNILIVDAGNFNGGMGRNNQIQAKYILTGMTLINYDAINMGKKDLLLGKRYLSLMKNKYNIPFISANIYDSKSNQLFVRPYIIKQFGSKKISGIVHGGFKVGIFGVMIKAALKISDQEYEHDFYIKDPEEATKQMVRKLRKKCDIIVALFNLDLEKTVELAKKIEGIDIIVCGRYPSVQYEPLLIENTLIVQSGALGKYIGELDLTLDNSNKIQDHNGSLTPLNAEIPDDPLMVEILKKYQSELESRTNKMTNQSSITHATLALYMGSEKCVDCHKNQYSQWKNTRHANAFITLREEKNEQNPVCQKCHTTGFKNFNGFDDLSSTPDMINVQCEACHGYMFKHLYQIRNNEQLENNIKKIAGNHDQTQNCKSVDALVCIKCHDKKHDPDFNFEEDKKKIIH